MKLRNDHAYGETYEAKRLRLRSNAEDPRPGIDLHDDHTDGYAPAPWWYVDPLCASPETLVMVGSRSTDAAPLTPPMDRQAGAATNSAAGRLGGSSSRPAAHPSQEAA